VDGTALRRWEMGNDLGISCAWLVRLARRGMLALALSGLSVVWLAGSASVGRAAFRGGDGRIAFMLQAGGSVTPQSCEDVFTIHPDGLDLRRVTPGCPAQYSDPAFSAAGSRLALIRIPRSRTGAGGVYTIDSDGSHLRRVTRSIGDGEPAFSPSGRSIVFDAFVKHAHSDQLFTVNADGSGLRELTHRGDAEEPTFSPNGRRIAFSRIHGGNAISGRGRVDVYTVNSDGSHIRQVTHAPATIAYLEPDYSPNGREIVFSCGARYFFQVCLVRTDGTHFKRLTSAGKSGFTAFDAVFSPSGQQIAFLGLDGCVTPHGGCGDHPVVLYTMNRDGSDRHKVYTLGRKESLSFEGLSWQSTP
jgi:Tol biopolymer transport system component